MVISSNTPRLRGSSEHVAFIFVKTFVDECMVKLENFDEIML